MSVLLEENNDDIRVSDRPESASVTVNSNSENGISSNETQNGSKDMELTLDDSNLDGMY